MSGGFTMVYGSIFDGTLMGKWPAAAVFATLLPLADKDGNIDINPTLVAYKSGWPIEVLTEGVKQLMQPDPLSRSQDKDGRRLELIDPNRPWGWHVVNHKLYREKSRLAQKNALYTESGKDAERKRAERERKSGAKPTAEPESSPPAPVAPVSTPAPQPVKAQQKSAQSNDRVTPIKLMADWIISGKSGNRSFIQGVRASLKRDGTISKAQLAAIARDEGWRAIKAEDDYWTPRPSDQDETPRTNVDPQHDVNGQSRPSPSSEPEPDERPEPQAAATSDPVEIDPPPYEGATSRRSRSVSDPERKLPF
jgi:hypothetical protein